MSLSRPVYSTDHGRLCPGCGKPVPACVCKQAKAAPPPSGPVMVRRETGGRGGKTVTTVQGLPLQEPLLSELARQLKAVCGSGGTVKDGVVEIQGDHVERVIAWLMARPEGWTVKRSGG